MKNGLVLLMLPNAAEDVKGIFWQWVCKSRKHRQGAAWTTSFTDGLGCVLSRQVPMMVAGNCYRSDKVAAPLKRCPDTNPDNKPATNLMRRGYKSCHGQGTNPDIKPDS